MDHHFKQALNSFKIFLLKNGILFRKTKSNYLFTQSLGDLRPSVRPEEANARKLQTPRSLHLIGEFNREIKQPAKRRKIAVAPLMVGDIRADSCDPVVKEKVKKINYAKNFILEMKNTLEEESYAQFDMVIRNFHKDHNLDELISKLAVLFPAEDPYFRDVFRDCSKILCGKNLEAFQKYCDEKYPV
ncbi:uncharacterized protein LOC106666585 [Cimex lectularius]|uniref:Uncharacterized protein n=1 Tax=Cimex lectularius TaxID=79782 RepID=A0A8I6RN31_CIMLE|nr:uncharacterized protein LOC106666585 [Cimex lectularius]